MAGAASGWQIMCDMSHPRSAAACAAKYGAPVYLCVGRSENKDH